MFPGRSGPSGNCCMYPMLTTEVLQKAFPAWPFHSQCMTVIRLCVFFFTCRVVLWLNKGAAHVLGSLSGSQVCRTGGRFCHFDTGLVGFSSNSREWWWFSEFQVLTGRLSCLFSAKLPHVACLSHQTLLRNYTFVQFPSALSEVRDSFTRVFLFYICSQNFDPVLTNIFFLWTLRLVGIVEVVDNFLAGKFLTSTSAWYFPSLSPYYLCLSLIIWHLFLCISRYKQKGIIVVSFHISLSCMFVYCRYKFIMAHAGPLLS